MMHVVAYEAIDKAGKKIRRLPLPDQTTPGRSPWTEWEGLDGTIALVEGNALGPNADPILPDGVSPLSRPSDLSPAERTTLLDSVRALSGNANPTQALRARYGTPTRGINEFRISELIQFAVASRRKPRLNQNGDIVVDGPERGPARPLPFLAAGGAAVATTASLDTFDDSATPPAGWSTSIDGTASRRLVEGSGVVAGETASQYNSGIWETAYDRDCESWWIPSAFNGGQGAYIRIQDYGSSAVDGFDVFLNIGSPDAVEVYRIDNNSLTQLGASYTGADPLSTGVEYLVTASTDDITLHIDGTLHVTRTDSTYTSGADAYGGLELFGTSDTVTEYGGGALSTSVGGTINMLMMGVG